MNTEPSAVAPDAIVFLGYQVSVIKRINIVFAKGGRAFSASGSHPFVVSPTHQISVAEFILASGATALGSVITLRAFKNGSPTALRRAIVIACDFG